MYAPVRFDRFAIELGVRRQQGSSIIVYSGLTSTSDLFKCTQQIPKAPFEIFRGGQYPYRLLKIEADDVCVFRVFRVRGGIDPWAARDTPHDLKLWFVCDVIGWIDFMFWYLSSLASSDFLLSQSTHHQQRHRPQPRTRTNGRRRSMAVSWNAVGRSNCVTLQIVSFHPPDTVPTQSSAPQHHEPPPPRRRTRAAGTATVRPRCRDGPALGVPERKAILEGV